MTFLCCLISCCSRYHLFAFGGRQQLQVWQTCRVSSATPSVLELIAVLQDKNNRLSFTLERPCACPITCLPWPFNCTILSPLKVFVRGATGELQGFQSQWVLMHILSTILGFDVPDRQARTNAPLLSAAGTLTESYSSASDAQRKCDAGIATVVINWQQHLHPICGTEPCRLQVVFWGMLSR